MDSNQSQATKGPEYYFENNCRVLWASLSAEAQKSLVYAAMKSTEASRETYKMSEETFISAMAHYGYEATVSWGTNNGKRHGVVINVSRYFSGAHQGEAASNVRIEHKNCVDLDFRAVLSHFLSFPII